MHFVDLRIDTMTGFCENVLQLVSTAVPLIYGL